MKSEPWSALTRSYDEMGRVTGSRQRTPPAVSVAEAKSFSYAYNAAGGLEVETYPTGRVVKTCYDVQGRVKTVWQKLNATAAEKVVARLEDVDANTRAYEAHGGEKYLRLGEAGQIVEQTAYNLSLQPYRKNVGTIWSMDLHYCGGGVSSTDCGSNNGNILKQVVLAPGNSGAYTMNYGYDSLNRITSAVELKPDGLTENWHQTFAYDRFGNRAVLNDAGTFFAKLAATPTVMNLNDGLPFDGKNRWLGAAYDAAGNQSTTWGAGVEAGSAQYEYNGENLLKQALVSNGVGMVTYGYDAEGRRVTAATGAGQTTFVYDAFGMLAMETGNVNTGGTGCTSCLVTADHLGSTRVVWDAGSGDPKRVYDYAPFGEEIDAAKRGGNPLYPATVYPSGTRNAVTQMFTGKERDAETGQDYFGARYLSAAQGRFTSPDVPLVDQHATDPQSWNLYTYVRNNPLRNVDPSGRDCIGAAAGTQNASSCADQLIGGAKAIANTVTDTLNAPTAAVNLLISPFTDFQFPNLFQPLATPSNEEQRQGMESMQITLVVSPIAEMTATKAASAAGGPKTTEPLLKTVTSWADVGTKPDLNPGRWVQLGEPTKTNYFLTGLPGPKGYLQPTPPFVRIEWPKSAFSNHITGQVPASSLQWPQGGEFWKGVFGQRQIKAK